MEKAIASFDSQDEVLFLVDLWGGTPFNQANALLDEHADKWAIVSGMNLPMVVEALTQRMMNANATAHEIATAVVQPAEDGIKTKPAALMPKTEKAAPAQDENGSAPKKSIPEGTVLGDGHIKYVLARIDSRLLHGQVATGWIPAMHPDRVIVVSVRKMSIQGRDAHFLLFVMDI